jgi:hypothetical protein
MAADFSGFTLTTELLRKPVRNLARMAGDKQIECWIRFGYSRDYV